MAYYGRFISGGVEYHIMMKLVSYATNADIDYTVVSDSFHAIM